MGFDDKDTLFGSDSAPQNMELQSNLVVQIKLEQSTWQMNGPGYMPALIFSRFAYVDEQCVDTEAVVYVRNRVLFDRGFCLGNDIRGIHENCRAPS